MTPSNQDQNLLNWTMFGAWVWKFYKGGVDAGRGWVDKLVLHCFEHLPKRRVIFCKAHYVITLKSGPSSGKIYWIFWGNFFISINITIAYHIFFLVFFYYLLNSVTILAFISCYNWSLNFVTIGVFEFCYNLSLKFV